MVLGQPCRREDNQARGFTQLTPWCRKAWGNLPVSNSCKLIICPSSIAKHVQGVSYRRFLLNHSISTFVRAKQSKQAIATTFTKIIFTVWKDSWKYTHFILFNTRTFALTITARRCSSKVADRASKKLQKAFCGKTQNMSVPLHPPLSFWTFSLWDKRFLWQKHW